MGDSEMWDEILKVIKRIHIRADAMEKYSFDSLGLSPNQSAVISVIDRDLFYTHTKIAKEIGLSKSTLSGALNALEQKGLIERAGSKDDKRKSFINLTRQGRELRSAILSGGPKGLLEAADMTELEKKLLYILLKKLSSHLEEID